MNLESPKTRFLKTADAKWLADLTVNPTFIRCLDVAILQMAENIGPVMDNDTIANNAYMLCGANIFRRILLRLADPETQRPPPPNDNLNPD